MRGRTTQRGTSRRLADQLNSWWPTATSAGSLSSTSSACLSDSTRRATRSAESRTMGSAAGCSPIARTSTASSTSATRSLSSPRTSTASCPPPICRRRNAACVASRRPGHPQVDEHLHLGAQDPGVERLRDVVGAARGVAAVGVVRCSVSTAVRKMIGTSLVRLRPLDPRRGLESVHAGHLRVEQDQRVVVLEQRAQRLLAGARPDQLLVERAQDRLEREEVLGSVVDQEDLGPLGHDSHEPEDREQLVDVDRLGDVVGGARGQAVLPVAGHRLRGQRDDREVCGTPAPSGSRAWRCSRPCPASSRPSAPGRSPGPAGASGGRPRRSRRRPRRCRAAPARWSARTRCGRRRRRSGSACR